MSALELGSPNDTQAAALVSITQGQCPSTLLCMRIPWDSFKNTVPGPQL